MNKITSTFDYDMLNSSGASIDANYGPWASISAYETWLADEFGIETIPEGTTIAVQDSTTHKITKYLRENNAWREDGGTSTPGQKGDKGDKGDTGDAGADGKSAYQLAVEQGYTGTLTEWLASLKGADGQQGADGAQGEKGDKGDTGAQGPQGDKGDTGAQGPQGEKGDTGTDGQDGLTTSITINGETKTVDSNGNINLGTIGGASTADEVTYDPTSTSPAGSVGAKLTELSLQIGDSNSGLTKDVADLDEGLGAVEDRVDLVEANVGDMSTLSSNLKSNNLVDAINEIVSANTEEVHFVIQKQTDDGYVDAVGAVAHVVDYNNEQIATLTVNSDGKAVITSASQAYKDKYSNWEDAECVIIDGRTNYTVTFDDYSGYLSLADLKYQATLNVRTVTAKFNKPSQNQYENVKISIANYSEVKAKTSDNIEVYLYYGSTLQAQAVIDSSGMCVFYNIPHGTTYTLKFGTATGFTPSTNRSYLSSLSERNVIVRYYAATSVNSLVVKTITNGEWTGVSQIELTLENLKNYLATQEDDSNIVGIRLGGSNLNRGDAGQFTVLVPWEYIKANKIGNRQYSSINQDFKNLDSGDSLPYVSNGSTDLSMYDGQSNTLLVLKNAREAIVDSSSYRGKGNYVYGVNASGSQPSIGEAIADLRYEGADKNYVLIRNAKDDAGTLVSDTVTAFSSVNNIDARIIWARTDIKALLGVGDDWSTHCFLGAFYQMQNLSSCVVAFNGIVNSGELKYSDGTTFTTNLIGINSGYWWTSSQYNAYNGVILNNGGFNIISKRNYNGCVPMLAY